ncbi:hypothetical protein HK099_005156 [Clydaea vesicula]|uniref:Pirin n=1 Tax=Clydaea vesicula TaxID=447962 RepID=A0AAD5XV58_9FUNG|nr:hypothetical protein HK099_005156 [Clydaea vesicula]KAJ3382490.1 hypothetical protein HDU92_004750 [Lobulomyces angularis]
MGINTSESAIRLIQKLNVPTPMKTQDPFLFSVYHKDLYPKGNEKMEAPRIGNGSDFGVNQPYRMYHGEKIPGFPQHPHRGFETITCTLEGLVDHTDSLKSSGRYGNGDLQWMTAGKGIVHGENFPLLNIDKPNPLRFFQIWLNLPSKSKMVQPAQLMHWSENVKRYESNDKLVKVVVWAGEIFGVKALEPIENSWAKDPNNDVNIWFFTLKPGAKVTIPNAKNSASTRSLYFVEGKEMRLASKLIDSSTLVELDATFEVEVENIGTDESEFLILQGKPIGEPVVQQGPFVMNKEEEIQQTFSEYRKTRFGGWPWEQDAVIFPRETGRFISDGKTSQYPPKKI